MKKILFIIILVTLSIQAKASGSGLSIESVFYCGDDFSMVMSNGERWVVKKSQVGEQKLNHFISMALFMMASGKTTLNVFPGTPERWCGNDNTRPITVFSFSK
ncbi:hypothetical protein [Teredinibacter sp. KSP-S5-2]|uniref:hypothetical protein n=1 Tax=Teredinibacter sp. KSP-S5-2 TaxID=3034506 RepID=UPI002934F512|nr:hypothetical protein [Teredinibacter sp. KSP-S5-2]WNO10052.1 hypothetical protein P5V12_02590 [Teredinibacter sp. KSP-S5-2]